MESAIARTTAAEQLVIGVIKRGVANAIIPVSYTHLDVYKRQLR